MPIILNECAFSCLVGHHIHVSLDSGGSACLSQSQVLLHICLLIESYFGILVLFG